MNDAMPKTALAPWTGNPVLRPTAISCDDLSGIYGILDASDSQVLERHAERIAHLCDATSRTLTTAIIEIGCELFGAQALLAGKGRDGQFRPWCRSQGFAMSSVYRAIAAYEVFKKCPTVGHFDAKAVYLLSADSCPEDATEEAMRLAAEGVYIDHKRAKAIAAEYAPRNAADGAEPAAQADVENAVKHASKGTIGDTVRPDVIVAKDTADGKPVASQPDGEIVAEQASKDIAGGSLVVPHPDDDIVAGEVVVNEQGTGVATVEHPATAGVDVVVSAAEVDHQTTQKGLVGLQAVISALEDLGIYDEYQDFLGRIRVALEQNVAGQDADSGEICEWRS